MSNNTPIFVTGAPRSGKTMIAGVLRISGAYFGTVDNMLENIPLTRELVEPYMQQQKIYPFAHRGLQNSRELQIPKNWGEQVENIVMDDGYNEGEWAYKTSKIAATWPAWAYAFPKARYVLVRRRPGDIVKSCVKTGYLKEHDTEEGWLQMVKAYEDKLVEMIYEGLNCKIIWPHRMVNGDYEQLYELLDWLGLPWKSEILSYIDPKFWKTRKKQKQWQDQ